MRWSLPSALMLAVVALPAAAQRPAAPSAPMRGPAAAMLAARESLGLTADQVSRLEALAATQAKAMPGNPGDAMRARADMLDAMKGEGDAAALKRAMDRMHQVRTERALAALRFRQEARAVLSAEQRAKADAWMASRRMGRGGGGRGGLRGRGVDRGPRGPRRGPPADRRP